jgi:hypothetical protein
MNISTTQKTASSIGGFLPSLLVAAGLALGGVRAHAAANSGVLPVVSKPHGKSYGEWAGAYWQWALSIPADRNPITDATGAFAGEAQSGPVWFLAGTFGNSADRSSTIPAGKTLLVPVSHWIFGAGVFDCDPTVPGVPCDVDALRLTAAANTEAADVLEVTIDGVPVQNVRNYRAFSADPFSLTFPENSVVGVPAGTYSPQVADGYWLMLAPLSNGAHTIEIRVRAPGTIFGLIEYTVIHRLTIE